MKKFADKIHTEDQKLREKYYDLPKEFPKESLPPNGKVDRVTLIYIIQLIERSIKKAFVV